MTIAAGFQCSDGIILCADTEHTGGSKLNRPKIFPLHEDLIVTGAGHDNLIRLAVEDLRRSFGAGASFGAEEVRLKLTEILIEIHQRHLFAFYRPDDLNRPNLSLLVAVRDSSGLLALFSSTDTTVNPVDTYEVLGTGAELGHFIASWLHEPGQDVSVVKIIGLYMIGQAKRHALYCGGDSQMFVIYKDRERNRRPRVTFWDETQIIANFHSDLQPVLIGTYDRGITDEEFNKRLARLVNKLRAIREASAQIDDKLPGLRL
jgi:hypothetical protein